MPRFRQIRNKRVQFTPEEETQRDADEAQAVIDAQTREDAETARLANIASVKAKLEALGLTADEVRDTFGLLS